MEIRHENVNELLSAITSFRREASPQPASPAVIAAVRSMRKKGITLREQRLLDFEEEESRFLQQVLFPNEAKDVQGFVMGDFPVLRVTMKKLRALRRILEDGFTLQELGGRPQDSVENWKRSCRQRFLDRLLTFAVDSTDLSAWTRVERYVAKYPELEFDIKANAARLLELRLELKDCSTKELRATVSFAERNSLQHPRLETLVREVIEAEFRLAQVERNLTAARRAIREYRGRFPNDKKSLARFKRLLETIKQDIAEFKSAHHHGIATFDKDEHINRSDEENSHFW